MIYIFEDRASRKELHQKVMDDYRDVVSFAKFDIDEGQDLSDFIIENFCEADCILFHKSYVFKNKQVNIPVVQRYMLQNGVKFCIYSGGIERGSINSDGIAWINANVMYDNISIFVEQYKRTNEISFEVLLWGERNRLNQLISLQYDLFEQFFTNNSFDDYIIYDDLEGVCDDIQNKFEEYGFDISEMLDNILSVSDRRLTWRELYDMLHYEISKIERIL